MDGERLPDAQVEEALRLLLEEGCKDAAFLLGEVSAVHVVHGSGSDGFTLDLTFEEVVAEELGRRERRQIADALTYVLASSGRTVTDVTIRTIAGVPRLVDADPRPWRAKFVDRFRESLADQRYVYLLCAVVAFALPVAIVLGTDPSWVWAAWLVGGWTCGLLLLRFWRWLDPRRPFTRGHITRVAELGDGSMSVAALCSCGWIGSFGDSMERGIAEARRHATAEPDVLRAADVTRILAMEPPADEPPGEPA